ncbi:hypothetical protein ABIC71_003934 [Herbaspirillum seropedicae]|uniref:hypothetical protein n=1 Tax=Herbaspirillum seropedicae TaxID=964 RepID=UPI00339A58FB
MTNRQRHRNLSSDDPPIDMPQPCPICATTRGLSEHLTEVAFAAQYLGNTSTYQSEHGTTKIRTETIGAWLRLASQLKTVKIDPWKFEPTAEDASYCEPVAGSIRDHGQHYTTHATALTRFVFVCNGLEEAYRFIDHLYGPLSICKSIAKKHFKRTSSMRAVALLEELFEREGAAAAPKDFEHHCRNFIGFFNIYKAEHKVAVADIGTNTLPTYALQLVRTLRNHVAHGTFPLAPPADYGGFDDSKELVLMLRHACRVAALYIQIILKWFTTGFESHDYKAMLDAHGKEFNRFIENCTLEYVLDLHLTGNFALHDGLYSNQDLED